MDVPAPAAKTPLLRLAILRAAAIGLAGDISGPIPARLFAACAEDGLRVMAGLYWDIGSGNLPA